MARVRRVWVTEWSEGLPRYAAALQVTSLGFVGVWRALGGDNTFDFLIENHK